MKQVAFLKYMKRKLTLIALFISLGFWQVFESAIHSQNKPLTLSQIANSLNVSNDKKKESAITAKKVRQVGVTFRLTPEIEVELRNAGATNELIEAIRENSPPLPTPIPKPITQVLNIISTPPESEIYIDEVFRGRTDVSGNIRIADLPIGEYRITIRKARYKEVVFSLSLSPNNEGQITANLELAVGFLTVKTNVPNPTIEISKLGRFDNSISKFECQTGTYSVTISSPLFVTSRKEISVSAGQETELSVTLEADSAARNRLISEALSAYSSKQYDQAIALSRTLISVDSTNAQALTVLAQSYFKKDDFYTFTVFAEQALDAGSSLEFNLLHHDFLMTGLNVNSITQGLHPVKLTLTASSISLDPQVRQERSCSFRKSDLPIDNLSVAQVDETGGGFFKKVAGIYLKIVMQHPTKPKKTDNFNFTDPASDFVEETRGKTIIKSRASAARALTAIAALLNRTKAKMSKQ